MKKIKAFLKGRAALFALVLLATVGMSGSLFPGKAYAAWGDCASGRVCFWVDTNGGGSMGWVNDTTSTCRVFNSTYANKISSVWNRMSYPVRFYTSDNCFGTLSGYWYTVEAGQQINFTSWPHADNFESMKVNP